MLTLRLSSPKDEWNCEEYHMRKLLITTVAALALTGPALAQVVVKDSGPMAGPIIEIRPAAREYVIANPRPPVILEGRISEGYVVPENVELVPVPDQPEYVYFYGEDNQPVIVRAEDRSVVYVEQSNGDVVAVEEDLPDELIGYIRENPIDPIVIEEEIDVGYVVPTELEVQPIDGYQGYSYFYHNGRPYVVDQSSRRVVYLAR